MPLMSVISMAVCLQAESIDKYLQSGIRDASFTTRVIRADQNELKKINNDFGELYHFDSIRVELKEPFKVRLDAQVEDTNVLYLVNGPNQLISVPRMRVHQKTNLTTKPGRRQTLFDFGLLTPSLFDSYLKAKFIRTDRSTGDPVFDVTYQSPNDTSRSRIWIDPSKDIIAKREWYNQTGRELATFYYLKPQKVSGIWIPTRLEVRNMDDQIAGISQYQSIQVNQGISDDKFAMP